MDLKNWKNEDLRAAAAVGAHLEWKTFARLVSRLAGEEKAKLYADAFDSSPISHGKLVGRLDGMERVTRLPALAHAELERRRKAAKSEET